MTSQIKKNLLSFLSNGLQSFVMKCKLSKRERERESKIDPIPYHSILKTFPDLLEGFTRICWRIVCASFCFVRDHCTKINNREIKRFGKSRSVTPTKRPLFYWVRVPHTACKARWSLNFVHDKLLQTIKAAAWKTRMRSFYSTCYHRLSLPLPWYAAMFVVAPFFHFALLCYTQYLAVWEVRV